MECRPYGKTGEEVSILSMGGMRFAEPDAIDKMAEIPLYLYDHGVNYFDTAPGYCGQKSEDILGVAVKEMSRRRADGGHDFLISTKSNKPDPKRVREELETSLRKLNVEQIDFYHIWCIRTWDEWEERKAGGAVDEFLKARDEGLVKHVVISHHLDSDGAKRLMDEAPVEGMLLGFNATNWQYRLGGIQAGHAQGLGVMIMNPLGGGVYWTAPERFEYLKTRDGDDLVRGALRFVLSHREVTGCLAGVRTMGDAHQVIAAMEGMELYDADELATVRQAAIESYAELCTNCGYCMSCPKEIPVAMLMETCNSVLLGHPEGVFGRLKWHWAVDDVDSLVESCIDCGRCEELCTQHLPIRERLLVIRDAWLKTKPK
jgi:uncharacterized protein